MCVGKREFDCRLGDSLICCVVEVLNEFVEELAILVVDFLRYSGQMSDFQGEHEH